LHDMGKAATGFQEQLPSRRGPEEGLLEARQVCLEEGRLGREVRLGGLEEGVHPQSRLRRGRLGRLPCLLPEGLMPLLQERLGKRGEPLRHPLGA